MPSRNLHHDFNDLLLGIVDTAIEIGCADFGNIQLLDHDTGHLKIVAQRGFPGSWVNFWNQHATGEGSCGSALQFGRRVIIEDITKNPFFTGQALEVQLKTGVKALQSTPLFLKTGRAIGVFSTHYRQPWHPSVSILKTLDSLARLVVIAIDQAQSSL